MAKRLSTVSVLLGLSLTLSCFNPQAVFCSLILDNKTLPKISNISDIILRENQKEEGPDCKLSSQIIQFLLDETTARLELQYSLEGKIAELRKELQERKQLTVNSRGLKTGRESTVAFSASAGSHRTGLRRNQIIVFDRVSTNMGNAYSLMTGRFVCPVGGLYLFTVTILSNVGDRIETELVMSQKGSHTAISQAKVYSGGSTGRYGSGTNTVLLELEVEDELWVRVYNGIGTFVYRYWSTFSGVLLKPS